MSRWFVYSMFLNSGEHAASFLMPGKLIPFTLYLGLILLLQFPDGLENLLLSTSDFELPSIQFPGASD